MPPDLTLPPVMIRGNVLHWNYEAQNDSSLQLFIPRYGLEAGLNFMRSTLRTVVHKSFYSVCPEVLASYMAKKCGNIKVAVDPFCGAGGNVIQLAKIFDKVIAMDIDPEKILLAKHNSIIYEVFDKIEFIVGDFFTMANQIKGDVIVTSPPWGGPNHNETPVIGPLQLSLDKLLAVGKTVAPKVLLHLPKNIDKFECLKMCNGIGAEVRKVENVFMDRYLNSTLLYVRSNNMLSAEKTKNVLIKHRAVIDGCIEMVTVNGRPLRIMEDSGFRKIVDPIFRSFGFTMNAGVVRDHICNRASLVRKAITDQLKNNYFCIKMDTATRPGRIIHGKIIIRNPATAEIYETTSNNLKCVILKTLEKYSLSPEFIYSITTDNGANMLDTFFNGFFAFRSGTLDTRIVA
ncbi:hypothetical protein QTP88_027691 [Uroleucon formosanum]